MKFFAVNLVVLVAVATVVAAPGGQLHQRGLGRQVPQGGQGGQGYRDVLGGQVPQGGQGGQGYRDGLGGQGGQGYRDGLGGQVPQGGQGGQGYRDGQGGRVPQGGQGGSGNRGLGTVTRCTHNEECMNPCIHHYVQISSWACFYGQCFCGI